jgi:hypothetical protein
MAAIWNKSPDPFKRDDDDAGEIVDARRDQPGAAHGQRTRASGSPAAAWRRRSSGGWGVSPLR